MFTCGTAGGVGVVLLWLATIGGCGESSTAAPPSPATQRLPPRAVAACSEAGRPDPPKDWARDAAVAGPFGLYGPARDFHDQASAVDLPNGQIGMKLPAIVERSAEVRVTVPPRLRRKVGLDYGDFKTESRVEGANSVVTFKPCEGHIRTGWPGGLVLKSRRPIELEVQVEGKANVRTLAVGE